MENILIFAIVGLLIGMGKGGLGGSAPVALTVPLLSFVIPAQQAVGFVLPLLMFADIFSLYFYWKDWENRHVLLLLIPGLIGVALGIFVLNDIDAQTLKRIIGGFTLIAISFKIISDQLKSLQYQPQKWHGWLAGSTAGFASALANVGGPPIIVYLLMQSDMPPRKFIGTMTLFFSIINWSKLPIFIGLGILDVNQFLSVAWVLIIIPFAIYGARYVITRIDKKTFEWMMMIPLFVLSIGMLFFS